MRSYVLVGIVGVGVVMAARPVAGHHAFAAEFDATKPITVTGTVTKTEWVNPHSWIYMDGKDPAGKAASWSIEVGAPNAMFRRGLRKENFPIGSQIVVKGYLSKKDPHVVNGGSVTFTDGKNFLLGAPGTGAPEPPK